jgi:hypothetical protein
MSSIFHRAQNAGEAEVAALEEALEERTDELKQARLRVVGLERDCVEVEERLRRAAEERRETQSELARLRAGLQASERSNGHLKRRLEALGAGAATAFGLSAQGLRLRSLDLAACVVQVHNATNMDVSLAGWTVRVVGGSHLLPAAAAAAVVAANTMAGFQNNNSGCDQPEGVVVVRSPKRGRGGRSRRDSLVARRHAFYFPFDFMLAAGSAATIR